MLPLPFASLPSHSSALPLPPFLVPCTSDHGNPGAWHGTSTAALATTVACMRGAEVLKSGMKLCICMSTCLRDS